MKGDGFAPAQLEMSGGLGVSHLKKLHAFGHKAQNHAALVFIKYALGDPSDLVAWLHKVARLALPFIARLPSLR